jgi:uncharacterized membrane-anchored protein YhcB (DUF1043 family)
VEIWGLLGNYGLPGLCVLSVIFGLLVPKPSVVRDQQQFQKLLDRAEKDRDEWKDMAIRSMEREAELIRGPGQAVARMAEHVAVKDTT